ncbi:HAD-IB family hydrolase [Iamia majanohamensis]|uniref:HAD-IB family hydrolase n=1 Tax=Iamia majanohamensis TaxID=467976 RepID=A0AAF0BX51_9ACTN|nr:HAD-IB family hydrolase [Iamia majanohamensis]WCO68650.1 HAD-IB family hydrolase [Iamia majanohamensis]
MPARRPAAFFDLDRTLLRGASGPVITEALRAAGVVPDRPVPGEGLVYKLFDVVGETIPSMVLTRQMARVASGWDRRAVKEAGEAVARRLADDVLPFARLLIDHHQAEGRPVVMATTSPFDLVCPLADALGIDDVIATRYGERDGRYDGTVDGHFVWGPGKLAAAREWAADHDVDLGASWAYSDSVYDIPLLSAVAHPVAVNPDPRLRVVAALRRWPSQHFDVPEGVPKVAGVEPQQVLQALALPQLFPYVRFDVDGLEHIPTDGPAILVGNHRSYFDPLAIGFTIAKVGRPLRFLGKKEVFDAPVVGSLVAAMGGIRVDRGTGSDEPLRAAADALGAGELVAIMPQGTIPRGRAFFDPELKGRWGAARLATKARVPVIPLGLWGTERVWPRNARFPDVLAVGDPPTVRVRVGPPVELKHRSEDADTRRIMAAITDLLPAAARHPHDPTPEELARTLPPGAADAGDTDRRPGRD